MVFFELSRINMDTVLKKLNLVGLTEKCEVERITPVHEMEMYGGVYIPARLSSRGEMKSCIVFT